MKFKAWIENSEQPEERQGSCNDPVQANRQRRCEIPIICMTFSGVSNLTCQNICENKSQTDYTGSVLRTQAKGRLFGQLQQSVFFPFRQIDSPTLLPAPTSPFRLPVCLSPLLPCLAHFPFSLHIFLPYVYILGCNFLSCKSASLENVVSLRKIAPRILACSFLSH